MALIKWGCNLIIDEDQHLMESGLAFILAVLLKSARFIQLLISFNNQLWGSYKNLSSAYRFYLGTLKVLFVTTNEKNKVPHRANMTVRLV